MSLPRKAREAAVQILYQLEDATAALPADPGPALPNFFANFEHDEEARAPAEASVRGVCGQAARVDELIQKHAHKWKLQRMAKVDRNILRLATWELLERPEVQARVAINEAIELGKRFGSEGSSAFINGVLDPIAREVRPS